MSINTTTETYDSFIKNIIETRGQFGCGEEYHERHHIIPKCLGGSNDKSNLIDLFAREHFIAHRLLALENPNKKQRVQRELDINLLPKHAEKLGKQGKAKATCTQTKQKEY